MKTIEDGIDVYSNFAIKIGDNNQKDDNYISLNIAPAINTKGVDAIIYAETNGNPIFIASCLLNEDRVKILYTPENEAGNWWEHAVNDFDIDPGKFDEEIESLLVLAEVLK